MQFKCYSGLLAQAETDGSVLGNSDSGGGEPGESRSPESRPHLGEGEGSGCEPHAEDSHAPAELLHGTNLRASWKFLPSPFSRVLSVSFKVLASWDHINGGTRSLTDIKLLWVLQRAVNKLRRKIQMNNPKLNPKAAAACGALTCS